MFDARHVEYAVVKHFAAFTHKKGKKQAVKNWLDHRLLMTSYYITIPTDSHQTCASYWKLQVQMIILHEIHEIKDPPPLLNCE